MNAPLFHFQSEHFEAYICLEKIEAFGLDEGTRFWVRAAGNEYGSYKDASDQFIALQNSLDDYYGSGERIAGIQSANKDGEQ